VNRLVAGILTGCLFLGSSLLWSRQIPPVLFGASLPGALGCAASVILGLLILRAIRADTNRSGGD